MAHLLLLPPWATYQLLKVPSQVYPAFAGVASVVVTVVVVPDAAQALVTVVVTCRGRWWRGG
jgi:hypothetical protein